MLCADGCVLDTVISAVAAALSDVRLPLVRLDHKVDDESPIERNQIHILAEVCCFVLCFVSFGFTMYGFIKSKK